MQLGKLDEAEKIFKQVYEGSGENYIDALVNRGICLLLMNDNANDEATVCFQEALNKDPTHLEALTNYAVILFKHRRYGESHSSRTHDFETQLTNHSLADTMMRFQF